MGDLHFPTSHECLQPGMNCGNGCSGLIHLTKYTTSIHTYSIFFKYFNPLQLRHRPLGVRRETRDELLNELVNDLVNELVNKLINYWKWFMDAEPESQRVGVDGPLRRQTGACGSSHIYKLP